MDQVLVDQVLKIKFGEMQTYMNMSVLPLFCEAPVLVAYIPLQEALEQDLAQVTEVSVSGSVPELKVANKSGFTVLLMDGEELVGAKQNRVLNTTILLKKESETVIPVSCTESGRWGYTSNKFAASEAFMEPRLRASKLSDISMSLRRSGEYRSNQSRVWTEIETLHQEAGSISPTRAMRDVYAAKSGELDKFQSIFECKPGQRGCLVFINGAPVGLDYLSQEQVYRKVHPKLIKSYALQAHLEHQPDHPQPSLHDASGFLTRIIESSETRFGSIGIGFDHRLEGDGTVGSALVCDNELIHLAFFQRSSLRERRSFFSL